MLTSILKTRKPAEDNDLGASVIRHSIAAVLGRIVNLSTTALSSVVLARLLSTEDFGRFSVLLSCVSFFALISSFGLGQVALKMLGESASRHDRNDQWCIVYQIARVGILSSILGGFLSAVVFCLLVPSVIDADVDVGISSLLAFCVIVRGIMMVISEIARAFDLPVTANLLSGLNGGGIFNGLLLCSVAVFSVFSRLDWQTSVAVMVLASAALLPLSTWMLKKETRKSRNSLSRRNPRVFSSLEKATALDSNGVGTTASEYELRSTIIRNGFFMTIVLCIVFAADGADVFLPGINGDIGEAALYVAARRLTLMLGILTAVANMAVGGFVAQLYYSRKHDELTRMMRIASAAASIPAAILCSVIMLVPGGCLKLVYGESYVAASSYVLILVPAQFVVVCAGNGGTVLMMTGGERVVLIVQGISALILFTIGPAVVLLYGVSSFAFLVSTLLIVQSSISCWLAYRLKGIITLPGYKDCWVASVSFMKSIRERGFL
jgi:O-antigen/teichoic acid export membrane protein